MKITGINIVEFGCLKDTVISVSDGMNILSGKNESGKSTVMLFIRFMLYGLPKRSSKNYDRERCLSFDGHRAAGSMTLVHGGKNYKIERSAVGTSKISETLTVVCTDTGEKIPGEPHELFLGVPGEVFESSCSVGQMRAADISRAQAASAVENLMVSADESIDVKKVLDKLDKVRREYKLNKGEGGLLYKTQEEISELTAKKRAATERYVRFNEQKARLERKEKDLALTQAELSDGESRLEKIRAAQTLERFERLEASRKTLLINKEELNSLENSFSETGFVPDETHVFSLRSALGELGEAGGALNRAQKEYECASATGADAALAEIGRKAEAGGGVAAIMETADNADRKSRSAVVIGAICACIGVVLAVVAALMLSLAVTVACAAIAVILAVVAVLEFISSSSLKKRRDAICSEYGKEYAELEGYLSECVGQLARKRQEEAQMVAARVKRDAAVESAERARQRLASLVALSRAQKCETVMALCEAANAEIQRSELFCARRDEINKQIYALRALCESDAAALSDYDEEALRAFVGDDVPATDAASVAAVEKIVRFNKAKLAALSLEVSNLRESQAALGAGLYEDPVELGDRILALDKKLERDTECFEALMLAKESIEQASTSMSGNFTPEISRRAGEMLAQISEGKHASAQTNKSLDLNVEQDGFTFSADMLSGGTRDAAYVCLRIALMIKLFGAELPPLMLDEAMCQFDDGRTKTMLSLLSRLYEELGLQTLIFTCHNREAEMCEQLGIKANSIKM
ncbi:MAG: hypothetical protein E7653_01820 [Ruminococcaceae bacterium]|nr:hypothetical protein [Oscillospiraceae bacterium]